MCCVYVFFLYLINKLSFSNEAAMTSCRLRRLRGVCCSSFILLLLLLDIVSQFKLLGVILDNKLNFNLYVAQQCLIINRKLFSIKRLFYLPQATKLQFFKAFLLPYFDYGLSLSIYYHNSAIRKLCKSYYLCLKNLFRFSFLNLNIVNLV